MRPYWWSNGDLLTTGNDITCEAKVTKELTKEEAIKKHRQLWGYIAAKIDATKKLVSKSDAFNELFKGESVSRQCFLCEYNEQQKRKTDRCCSHCEYCPLCDKEDGEPCLKGLFDKFCEANDFEKQRAYAYKIAALPEVDKRTEQEKIYDELHKIYRENVGWGMSKNRYIWILGRNVIKQLKYTAAYEMHPLNFTITMYGIEIKEDKEHKNIILLCKKLGGNDE